MVTFRLCVIKVSEMAYNDGALANVHKAADVGRVDHAVLLNDHVVANVNGKEGHSIKCI